MSVRQRLPSVKNEFVSIVLGNPWHLTTYISNANGDVDMHPTVPQDEVEQLREVHLGPNLLLSSDALKM